MWFLEPEQQAELETHLAAVFPPDKLFDAILAADTVCAWARAEIDFPSALDERAAELDVMIASASRLSQLLQNRTSRPAGMNEDEAATQSSQLERMRQRAVDESHVLAPQHRGRGRRRLEWRDRLVAVMWHAYPAGVATKSVGGHFEETIEILLRFLDRDVANVHGVIIEALKRQKAPAIRVEAARLKSGNSIQ